MMSRRTRLLLAAAIVAGAILVGGMVDRAIVGGPAWRQLGAPAWANYSRHADLGMGLIAYPIEGIGATVLAVVAATSHRLDRSGNGPRAIWLYVSAAGYLAGLALTAKAAPIMLSLADRPSPAAATRAFVEFSSWGLYARGAVDAVALLAGIAVLACPERRR